MRLDGYKEDFIMENETIYFSQVQISLIFDKSISTINEHVKAIELSKPNSIKIFKVAQFEGRRTIRRDKLHYDIDFVYCLGIKAREYEVSTALLDKCKAIGIDINEVRVLPVKEREFFKLVKESLDGIYDFEEQYRVGKYLIDLYCSELTLAVEYDEKYHKKHHNLSLDLKREQVINDSIKNITFIRVAEGDEHQGLNRIIKFIFRAQ